MESRRTVLVVISSLLPWTNFLLSYIVLQKEIIGACIPSWYSDSSLTSLWSSPLLCALVATHLLRLVGPLAAVNIEQRSNTEGNFGYCDKRAICRKRLFADDMLVICLKVYGQWSCAVLCAAASASNQPRWHLKRFGPTNHAVHTSARLSSPN